MLFNLLSCKDDHITLTLWFGQIKSVTAKICNISRLKIITRRNFLGQMYPNICYLFKLTFLQSLVQKGIIKGKELDLTIEFLYMMEKIEKTKKLLNHVTKIAKNC